MSVTVTHKCPTSQRYETLYIINTQNFSPKSKTITHKCPKCSQSVEVNNDLYTISWKISNDLRYGVYVWHDGDPGDNRERAMS